MLGGINSGQAASGPDQSPSSAKAKDIATKFEKALDLLDDLSQELGGKTKVSIKDISQSESSSSTKQKAAQKQESQPGQQRSAESAAMATYVDEDLQTKKKKEDKKIGEKLGELLELEQELSDVEFEDAQHQEILEKFFQHMSTIKNRREELTRLEMQEERLEEELEKQEREKKKKEKRMKRGDESQG